MNAVVALNSMTEFMKRVLFALTLCSLQSTAWAAQVLSAIVPCPVAGPNSACLQVDIFSHERSEGARITGPKGLQQFMAVEGRLNGAAPALFAVSVFDASQGQLPLTAYLGRSAANHPLVLTDRGVFEITDAAYDLDFDDDYVIDAAHWRLAERFLKVPDAPLIFTAGKSTGVWDDDRKLCISAPMKAPGLLQIDAKRCAARLNNLAERRIQGDLAPEAVQLGRIKQLLPDLVNDRMGPLEKVATHFEDDQVGVAFFRIMGTRNLLVTPYYVHED